MIKFIFEGICHAAAAAVGMSAEASSLDGEFARRIWGQMSWRLLLCKLRFAFGDDHALQLQVARKRVADLREARAHAEWGLAALTGEEKRLRRLIGTNEVELRKLRGCIGAAKRRGQSQIVFAGLELEFAEWTALTLLLAAEGAEFRKILTSELPPKRISLEAVRQEALLANGRAVTELSVLAATYAACQATNALSKASLARSPAKRSAITAGSNGRLPGTEELWQWRSRQQTTMPAFNTASRLSATSNGTAKLG